MKQLVAAGAALVVASSVAVAIRLPRPDGTASLVPRPVVPTVAPTSALPTVSPTPTPTLTLSPTPSATATTAPPTSSPLPRTTGVATRATFGSAAPVQTGHWRYTAKGATVDVRISPTNPRAGQLVTWTIALSGPDGCCSAQVLYGDNQGAPEADEYCNGQKEYGRSGDARVMTTTHAYRRGGAYTPWISVLSECTPGAGEGTYYFTFKPTLRVTDGPLLSNGPWVPVGRIGDSVPSSDDDPDAGQYFLAEVRDHDGYPVSWYWDWGDGTRSPVIANPSRCVWPDDGGWIEAGASSHVAHEFPGPGTYVVRFLATTAGCDGKNPQTFKTFLTWTVHESGETAVAARSAT